MKSRRFNTIAREWTLNLGAAAALTFSPGVLLAAPLTDLLTAHQIRPMEPPEAAVDLDLPDLQGHRHALSEARGRWMVLTFFASWCGPCRSEMPSLQRLHDARGADGLTVMAISVDRSQQDALRYVESLGLTLPVLWDERGEAARLYNASTIPVSFVIDPSGVVVGVSQGARDWSRLTSLVDGLLSADRGDETTVAGYAAAQVPMGLPEDVLPPTATVRVPDPMPRVGEPFAVEVEVRWSGRFEEYLLHPPQIHLPEAVEQLEVSASAGTEEGRKTVSYTFQLVANAPGAFALDPVEIRYTPRLAQEPVSSRLKGPSIEVTGGPSKRVALGGLAAGGVIAAAAVLGVALRRRKNLGQEPQEDPYETLRARYDEARRRRMVGDVPGFLSEMEEIWREMGVAEGDKTLSAAIERARYGGLTPPMEILDRLQRQVERELVERRPVPEEDARAALRLTGERTEKEKESRA